MKHIPLTKEDKEHGYITKKYLCEICNIRRECWNGGGKPTNRKL